MEGYFEVDYDCCIYRLNYKKIILNGKGIDTETIENVMDKAYIAHTGRLYRMWDNKFYIENCDVQDVESYEDFYELLGNGYVVKNLVYVDGKLFMEQ